MPAASILTSFNKSVREIGVLSSYMADCAILESKYQYFISEIVMLRLFAIIEMNVSEVAIKLACGATYKNGTSPITLVTCSNINDAYYKMLNYGRSRPLRYLKWTNLTDIQKNIQYTLDISDKFFVNLNSHVSLIDEMRDIRNHIAHRNSGTAAKYYNQLQLLYGGNPRLSIGSFLTSTIRNTPCNIERYLLSVPIVLHDISKG